MAKAKPKPTHSYMRDPVPAKRVGQCPCCLKAHRSTKRGTMTRHGWKESGRQVGQYGCGFQWGACHGGSMRPLEQTDADALVILKRLSESIRSIRKDIKHHESDGEDSYGWSYERRTFDFHGEAEKRAKLEEILSKHYTVTASDRSMKVKGHRVHYVATRHLSIDVPRGTDAFKLTKDLVTGHSYDKRSEVLTVPSYATLRGEYVRDLKRVEKQLAAQRDAIKTAIIHHRENPSNGAADTKKRGKVTHWRQRIIREDWRTKKKVERVSIACRSRGAYILATEDVAKVTCSRCAKHLPKDD